MRRLGCVWGCDSDRLWLGVGLAQGETSKCCLCATFDTAGMRGDRLLGEWHAGLVVRTVVRYVFVHSWVLCRVDEGKKRLESWEVLQMLEEDGVYARPKTEELGHVSRRITSRHGMFPLGGGGAHAG